MPEIPIPCLLFPNRSCLAIDFELSKPKVADSETVANLVKNQGLTEAQAEFCANCSRALSEENLSRQV